MLNYMENNFDDSSTFGTASSCSDSTGTVDLSALTPYDVICGRHKAAFNNIGNRRFRITVSLNKMRYLKAKSRKEKSAVIQSIVDLVNISDGKFLERQGDSWVELTTKKAMAKVGHAIRDMIEASSCKSTRVAKSSVVLSSLQRHPYIVKAVPNVHEVYPVKPKDVVRHDYFEAFRRESFESFDSCMIDWLGLNSESLLDGCTEYDV